MFDYVNLLIMKKLKIKQQMLSVLLCILILMYSCQVYKPATLNDAVEKGKPVKVTYQGQRMEFEKVIAKEGNYYGLLKKDRKWIEMLLNEEYCQNIKLEKVSVFLSIAIPVVAITAGIVIISSVNFDVGLAE